jgi:hypothetical protein
MDFSQLNATNLKVYILNLVIFATGIKVVRINYNRKGQFIL